VFLASEHHLTVEEIWKHLNNRDKGVDPKTVQSALDLMVKAGLAREVRLEDGTICFEHAFEHKHHDHLICRQCGNMIEFTSPDIEKLQDDIAAKHNFVVEDHVLSLYGICGACAGKVKVPEPAPLTKTEREKLIPLRKLKPGKRGTVREISGGQGVARRMAAMGIRPGKHVVKVSAMLLGGPIVISIDGRQLALGNGMAGKILVDTEQ